MRLRKATQVFMAAALALAAILAVMPQKAWAANTSDTKFSFSFSGSNTRGTGARRKTDTTPVYVRVTEFTVRSVNFYVDGSMKDTGPWHNLTNGGVAKLTQAQHSKSNGKYSIHTQVKEAGYKYARLTGWTGGYSGRVSGVWSPDSMYTYTSLNK